MASCGLARQPILERTVTLDSPPQAQSCTFSEAVLKKREKSRELGIIDSDDEEDTFATKPLVDRQHSNHDHRAKRRRNDNELDIWLRYEVKGVFESLFGFWIAMSLLESILGGEKSHH